MMKRTIMHPDYWVEIPAGDCIIGLSNDQREHIWQQLLEQAGYHERPPAEKALMEAAIEQCRHQKRPNDEQIAVFGKAFYFAVLRASLRVTPPMQIVHVGRFYIGRFPIIREQTTKYRQWVSAANLPGVFEESVALYSDRVDKLFFQRVPSPEVGLGLEIAKEIGARMPTHEEWEKAARGTDGRLYPWGNEWDASRGKFHYGQNNTRIVNVPEYGDVVDDRLRSVDAFPNGQSPYGVWAMIGGLPELVGNMIEKKGRYERGWTFRESSPQSAFIDYLIANHGLSLNQVQVSLRLVMDKWPRQQWTGVDIQP